MKRSLLTWMIGGLCTILLVYTGVALWSSVPLAIVDLLVVGGFFCAQLAIGVFVLRGRLQHIHLAWIPLLCGGAIVVLGLTTASQASQYWTLSSGLSEATRLNLALRANAGVMVPWLSGAACCLGLWVLALWLAPQTRITTDEPSASWWKERLGPLMILTGACLWMFRYATQQLAQYEMTNASLNAAADQLAPVSAKFRYGGVLLQRSDWLGIVAFFLLSLAVIVLFWHRRWVWLLVVVPALVLIGYFPLRYDQKVQRTLTSFNVGGRRLTTWPRLMLPKSGRVILFDRDATWAPWTVWTPASRKTWQAKKPPSNRVGSIPSRAHRIVVAPSGQSRPLPSPCLVMKRLGQVSRAKRRAYAAFDRRLSWKTIRPQLRDWIRLGRCVVTVAVRQSWPRERASRYKKLPWWLNESTNAGLARFQIWHGRRPKVWAKAKVLQLSMHKGLLSTKEGPTWQRRLQEQIKSWLRQHPRSAAMLTLKGDMTWQQALSFIVQAQRTWHEAKLPKAAQKGARRGPILVHMP